MILAFETATQSVGVALADERGLVACMEVFQGRKHAETLIPAAEQLLAHVDATYADVTAVAVDIGPGLFTGLRVGVATAKAVALARNVEIISASSLELLAWAEASNPVGLRGSVLCVIDARRKELYGQVVSIGDDEVFLTGEAFVASAADVRARAEKECALTTVLGTGALTYAEFFADLVVVPGQPSARVLALGAVRHGHSVAPDTVELNYLRPPDAEINWVKR